MNSSFCSDLGLDYDCAVPLPRSAFDPESPLCPSLAEYLYEPANCDPGYWCGCSSTNASLCFPSNDTSATRWGGYFTTTNKSTGEEMVLTGWFEGDASKCPAGYYCPGNSDASRCVDLCEPSMFCQDPGEMKTCPEGSYCPVATVDPIPCQGLEACNSEGQRRFKVRGGSGIILLILILCIAYLYVGKHLLNRNARRAKVQKLASKMAANDDEHSGEATHQEVGADGTYDEEVRPAMMVHDEEEHPPGGGMPRRRSTLTSPEMIIDIEFEGLRLVVPNVGTIMRGVSGKIPHGSLTAIMGPSGAGKTTFLNIMSGKLDRTGGILKVNGEETELTELRKIIGFVPQEDIMLRELSVEEVVTHSALMRLPRDWSHKKKLGRVDEILESLAIDHIRDSVVGDEKRRGISGGERKRVNIAMEMVTKPSLLCLDEPTSGLDSTTCLTVIQSLKDLADTGANVITVLHQPKYEVFRLFDTVLLLGQGGMTVYYGPTTQMADYFEKRGFPCPTKTNPADFYMDVLSGMVPHATNPNFDKEDLFEAWMCAEENPDAVSPEQAKSEMEKITAQKSEEESEKKIKGFFRNMCGFFGTYFSDLGSHIFRDFKNGRTTRKTPGSIKQAQLLFKRACVQRLRTPFSTLLNIILMAIAGAVLPSLVDDEDMLYVGIPKSLSPDVEGQAAYLRQNVTPVDAIPNILVNIYLFLLIVSCLSVNVLGTERIVFFRETATGQYVVSYWFAKTMEIFLWLPIYTSAFALMGYSSEAWLLQPLKRYWLFILIDIVGFYGFGMLSSLLVGSGSAALLALVFGIIVAIAFSGAVMPYGDASEGYQKFINCWFLFWSTQGMVSEEYDHYRYAFDVERLNRETPNNYDDDFGSGQQAVGAGLGFGFDLSSSFARNAWFCALTAFAWHLLVLWTLKTKDHKKHR